MSVSTMLIGGSLSLSILSYVAPLALFFKTRCSEHVEPAPILQDLREKACGRPGIVLAVNKEVMTT